jgi:hypothetical protein
MISSGSKDGGSGLVGAGGVGNFVEAGGDIGPATCARTDVGPVISSTENAQTPIACIERRFMQSASAKLDAILRYFAARVP